MLLSAHETVFWLYRFPSRLQLFAKPGCVGGKKRTSNICIILLLLSWHLNYELSSSYLFCGALASHLKVIWKEAPSLLEIPRRTTRFSESWISSCGGYDNGREIIFSGKTLRKTCLDVTKYHDDFLCVRLLMLLSNDYCCRLLVITSSYRSPSSRLLAWGREMLSLNIFSPFHFPSFPPSMNIQAIINKWMFTLFLVLPMPFLLQPSWNILSIFLSSCSCT